MSFNHITKPIAMSHVSIEVCLESNLVGFQIALTDYQQQHSRTGRNHWKFRKTHYFIH